MRYLFGSCLLLLLLACSRQQASVDVSDKSINDSSIVAQPTSEDSISKIDTLTETNEKLNREEAAMSQKEIDKNYRDLMNGMEKLSKKVTEEGVTVECYDRTAEYGARCRELEPYLTRSQKKKMWELHRHLAGMVAA